MMDCTEDIENKNKLTLRILHKLQIAVHLQAQLFTYEHDKITLLMLAPFLLLVKHG